MDTSELQRLKQRYNIVGNCDALNRALDVAKQVASTDLSVLIVGESGVGKEIIPRLIHDNSPRKHEKYFAINCGSIPEGTIDSELFGHEKGSFTGAIGESEGYFGTANKGTIFLDEVGELPMATQARLLRVLETGEYIRVGGQKIMKTNVRIVAATNVNMHKAISEGRFREDLYYRLNTIPIQMPPLRDRGNDILLLFSLFTMQIAEKYGMSRITLTDEAKAIMLRYKWPGNVRQLRNITEQLSILSQERLITPAMLAKHGIVPNSDEETSIVSMGGLTQSDAHGYEQEIRFLANAVQVLTQEVNELKRVNAMSHPLQARLPAPSQPGTMGQPTVMDTSSPLGYRHVGGMDVDIQTPEEVLDDETLNINNMEKRNILKALQRNHYRRKAAADELGISERTLYRKIKAYGIEE
ncbi:MAG: sigma-54 dependent transcriptional regulator [Prevotella sp.]|uniref:sigma-54 interaction domain-containing protein n=1 Tax=Leyella stercorea TaxID=363265 RepID=UPI0028007D2E|nr:sigma-54 dependent transcriptional regulator [Leyella stercorea]MDY4197360.1 sigma-54 dependent transcriptional regulator [Prevotella sp.]